jgi:hypothetical protein
LLPSRAIYKRVYAIQGDSGGNVNIFGGDSIDHCQKKIHKNMCLIVSGYRDTAAWIWGALFFPATVRFFVCGAR